MKKHKSINKLNEPIKANSRRLKVHPISFNFKINIPATKNKMPIGKDNIAAMLAKEVGIINFRDSHRNKRLITISNHPENITPAELFFSIIPPLP